MWVCWSNAAALSETDQEMGDAMPRNILASRQAGYDDDFARLLDSFMLCSLHLTYYAAFPLDTVFFEIKWQ